MAALFAACGSDPKSVAVKKADIQKPADESRRFPGVNLVETQVIDKELLGKPFMPGGTLARYKKGQTEYEMFVARLPSALEAAIILPDWSKALAGAKLIPTFGGYFGQDAGRPVFVFAKGPWIAGVVGLNEKDADLAARTLAGRLDNK